MSDACALALNAITSAIADGWGTRTPIAWPAAPFEPDVEASFLKVDVLWGDGVVVTQEPTRRHTIAGVVQLTVHVPRMLGLGDAMLLAGFARALLNRREVAVVGGEPVRCGAASGSQRLPDDGTWARAVVRVPFTVDELVPA